MNRQEGSRRVAQHALLDALRRLCPDPLTELRDGLPAFTRAPDDGLPTRSRRRDARIRAAVRRVQALPKETEEHAPIVAVDLDTWVARWRLDALRDLAPHLVDYWARRAAAARQFYFPKVRPLPPTPRLDSDLEHHDPGQPLLADPDLESEDDFLTRARAHYQQRAQALVLRPHHQRRQLRRHAEWYVRSHVQGWTARRIADEAMTADDAPDVSTIRKGIADFARLLAGPE